MGMGLSLEWEDRVNFGKGADDMHRDSSGSQPLVLALLSGPWLLAWPFGLDHEMATGQQNQVVGSVVAPDPRHAAVVAAEGFYTGVQVFFDTLGAAPHGLQVDVSAGGARRGDAKLKAAVMATQTTFRFVQHHEGGAPSAVTDPATSITMNDRCIAAAVEEQQ